MVEAWDKKGLDRLGAEGWLLVEKTNNGWGGVDQQRLGRREPLEPSLVPT